MTYPNILVLDYLRKTKQIKPELQMKAEGYTNSGYQQVLTYEVKGGGFSWFGDAPAHKVLTAYGIIMFDDMSKVHHVDPNIITRTQNWLANLQKADGSWEVDKGGIAEGIIDRQNDVLRVTAYLTWALAETGYKGPQLQKAAHYIAAHLSGVQDAYALAVIANALVTVDKNSDEAGRALEKLVERKTEEARVAYWKSAAPTFTGAQSESADIETTGLAAYALLRSGRYGSLANKVLTYLVQKKDPQGTWGSTQATVWSLRALLAGMESAAGDTNGEVIVRINDKQAAAFAITPQDADVMRQVELKDHVREGKNEVEIKFSGKGSALYGISSKYYLPWQGIKGGGEGDAQPLDVDVNYDRTELAVNDLVTCRVKVTNRKRLAANMVIVDLGVPPGFEVQAEDLAELVGSKKIEKFSLTGRQVIIYLDVVKPGQTITFDYRLKAKFPLKAKTPKSAVYEYYTPKIRSESKPVAMVVRKV
ncbi:MAG: alpha-2-macroglobulin, partial [Armatimonadota bacterium]|nr:alpha-2-macroglobulin [Armatimonadota bacterium]